MKVIFRPFNQDFHILTILSISQVTKPIITKFHIQPPSFLICSNRPGHMPDMVKNLYLGLPVHGFNKHVVIFTAGEKKNSVRVHIMKPEG